jgi:hypothetical protein
MPKLVTNEEAREIDEAMTKGMRGPVVVKWIRALLEDREERIRLEREREGGR